jgi:tetratricopeptide (TPR) repeat protein
MQASPRIDELRQKFHENPRRYFAPLANEYRKAGDPEQAIAICRAHLAQQPGHMSGHVVYGQALYDARRPEEARSVFEKALSLDPDNAIVLRHLGHIAREKGDSAEARHWYSKALDLDTHDTEVAAYIAELTEPISEEVSPPGEPSAAAEGIQPTVDSPQPAEVSAHLADADSEGVEGDSDHLADADSEGVEGDSEPEVLDFVEAGGQPPPAAGRQPPGAGGQTPDAERQPPDAGRQPPDAGRQTPGAWPAAAPGDHASAEAPAADVPPARVEEDAEDIEAAGEVAWRKTPREQESPFITRTMADLYARQGYLAAALDVYRQLAIRHPEDEGIQQRIAELSRERGEEPAPVADEPVASDGPETVLEAAFDSASETVPADDLTAEDVDPHQQAAAGAQARSDEPADTFADLGDEPVYAPSSEDLNLATEEVEPPEPGVHFTEMELSDGMTVSPMELDESPFGELSWEDEKVEAASEASIPQEARFVDLPVALGEIQTSIDEAGVAATSPHHEDFPPAASEEQLAEPEPPGAEDEAAAAMVELEPVAEAGQPSADERTAPATESATGEEDVSPTAEAISPPAERSAPAAEEGGALVEEFAPLAEESEPVAEESGPVAEEPAPVAEEPAPVAEEFAPFAEDSAPVVEEFAPVVDEAPPVAEEFAPVAEAHAPAAEEIEPYAAVASEDESEESAVVAYSPEPPRDEDLPHFKPRTPTIREFFATLGAYRPSTRDQSITARAAIPDYASKDPAEDLPLAADAFSTLFPDSPVSEEDSRAAFALSGAMSGTAHNPTPSTVRTSPPKPVPPVTDAPDQAQESEEDIRRFREWLDGLADS